MIARAPGVVMVNSMMSTPPALMAAATWPSPLASSRRTIAVTPQVSIRSKTWRRLSLGILAVSLLCKASPRRAGYRCILVATASVTATSLAVT